MDSPGDNLLAEFGSVVDALRCAVEIQQELRARNEGVPEQRRMAFRIGINLGDVVVEGERIYGDGVNIAARLEGLADPGGICLSGTVYDHVENKVPLAYAYVGEQAVKNIAKPVRVYRVVMDGTVASTVRGKEAAQGETTHRSKMISRKLIVLAVTGFVLLVAVAAVLNHLSSQSTSPR